jgi:hypothetical protein
MLLGKGDNELDENVKYHAPAIFHATIWAIGFFAGLARVLRGRGNLNCRNAIGVAATSGFLAFGVCVTVRIDTISSNPYAPLGVAALIGLFGKEVHDKVRTQWAGRLSGGNGGQDDDK